MQAGYSKASPVSTPDKLMLSHASSVFKGFSCFCPRQTNVISCKLGIQRLLLKTFPSSFLTIITSCQHTITLPLAFSTRNILICFNHSLSNLINFTFLIVSQITFWSFLRLLSANLFLSTLHLAWKTTFRDFLFASRYISLFALPLLYSALYLPTSPTCGL